LTTQGGVFGLIAILLAAAMLETSSLPSDVPKLLACLGAGVVVGPTLGWLFARSYPSTQSPLHTVVALGLGGVAIYLYLTLEGDQKFWYYALLFWASLGLIAAPVIVLRRLKSDTQASGPGGHT